MTPQHFEQELRTRKAFAQSISSHIDSLEQALASERARLQAHIDASWLVWLEWQKAISRAK
jgi:hypothetical protein